MTLISDRQSESDMDSVRKSGNVLTNITSGRQYIIRTNKMLVLTDSPKYS